MKSMRPSSVAIFFATYFYLPSSPTDPLFVKVSKWHKSYLNFLTCEREAFLWFVSEREKCVGFIPSLLNRSRSLQILEFASFSILLVETFCRSNTVLFRDFVHIFIHDQCKYVYQWLNLTSLLKSFQPVFMHKNVSRTLTCGVKVNFLVP